MIFVETADDRKTMTSMIMSTTGAHIAVEIDRSRDVMETTEGSQMIDVLMIEGGRTTMTESLWKIESPWKIASGLRMSEGLTTTEDSPTTDDKPMTESGKMKSEGNRMIANPIDARTLMNLRKTSDEKFLHREASKESKNRSRTEW